MCSLLPTRPLPPTPPTHTHPPTTPTHPELLAGGFAHYAKPASLMRMYERFLNETGGDDTLIPILGVRAQRGEGPGWVVVVGTRASRAWHASLPRVLACHLPEPRAWRSTSPLLPQQRAPCHLPVPPARTTVHRGYAPHSKFLLCRMHRTDRVTDPLAPPAPPCLPAAAIRGVVRRKGLDVGRLLLCRPPGES